MDMQKLLGLPVLASEHGKKVDDLIIYVHYLMIALFVGWILYFFYALFRFNSKANPKADYVGVRGHASNYIEGVVALVEGVLLLGFAVPWWAASVDSDKFPTADQKPTVVRIVAQQFQWNIFYPGLDGTFGDQKPSLVTTDNPWGFDKADAKGKDDFNLLNIMHVPVNRPVVIRLTSRDVVHSFKVIAMRVTQDAIPGVPIPTQFTPTKTGKYQINCAQLCGIGHASMAGGQLIVETQEEYDKWVAEQVKALGTTAKSYD